MAIPQTPGGGAVIPCDYIITVKEGCNWSRVRAAVKEMVETSVLQIKIIKHDKYYVFYMLFSSPTECRLSQSPDFVTGLEWFKCCGLIR